MTDNREHVSITSKHYTSDGKRISTGRTSSYGRGGRESTIMHDKARVIAENVYEGHIVSETEGKKRLIGINEKETIIKEERVFEGETRVVGEREL